MNNSKISLILIHVGTRSCKRKIALSDILDEELLGSTSESEWDIEES